VGCTHVSAAVEQTGGRELGKLADKVAKVTDGGRGIGRAIAQAYLQEDAGVVVTAAREKAEIEGLVEEASPEKALAILADVSDPED
jgi:3-oxoacyl-[acyl-carrier protein] reductase